MYASDERDGKAIKTFVESSAQYKSSRYSQMHGAAYMAGHRITRLRGATTSPNNVQKLIAAAALVGVTVDPGKRWEKLAAKYGRTGCTEQARQMSKLAAEARAQVAA